MYTRLRFSDFTFLCKPVKIEINLTTNMKDMSLWQKTWQGAKMSMIN